MREFGGGPWCVLVRGDWIILECSHSGGGLREYHLSPASARTLAADLADAADQVQGRETKSS